MRVLLDESVPRRLARDLRGHEVKTVPAVGWAGKDNGELLSLASQAFDVLVTVDKKLEHQQNLSKFAIAVVVLEANTNRYADLAALVPKLLESLQHVVPGRCFRITR